MPLKIGLTLPKKNVFLGEYTPCLTEMIIFFGVRTTVAIKLKAAHTTHTPHVPLSTIII